jgi:hypothetical protein
VAIHPRREAAQLRAATGETSPGKPSGRRPAPRSAVTEVLLIQRSNCQDLWIKIF